MSIESTKLNVIVPKPELPQSTIQSTGAPEKKTSVEIGGVQEPRGAAKLRVATENANGATPPPPAGTSPAANQTMTSYVVFLGTDGATAMAQRQVRGHLDAIIRDRQCEVDKALSSPGAQRYVVNLSPAEADFFRKKGVRVIENTPVVLNPPERGDASQGEVPLNRRVHGAAELQAGGRFRGDGVAIIVVDTGIANHKDLPEVVRFDNVFTDAPEDPNDDQNGHGTHCAGIALADGNLDAGGVMGLAPDATLMGVQVLDKDGSGSWASVLKGVERAIEFAKEHDGPVVISLSLGGTASGNPEDDPIVQAVNAAVRDHGIFFAIAAGNEGSQGLGTISSPGVADAAATVAAMDHKRTETPADDSIASFSSRGQPPGGAPGQVGKPDIAASGVNIRSTFLDGGYAVYSGTSMATPAVAGGAAALLSELWRLYKKGDFQVDPRELVKSGELLAIMQEAALDNPDVEEHIEGEGDMRLKAAAEILLERYGVPAHREAVQRLEEIVNAHIEDDGERTLGEIDETLLSLGRLAKDLPDADSVLAYCDGAKALFATLNEQFDEDTRAQIAETLAALAVDATRERSLQPFANAEDAIALTANLAGRMRTIGDASVANPEQHFHDTAVRVAQGLAAPDRIEFLKAVADQLAAHPMVTTPKTERWLRSTLYDAFVERATMPLPSAEAAAALVEDATGWLKSDPQLDNTSKATWLGNIVANSVRSIEVKDRVAYLSSLRTNLTRAQADRGSWADISDSITPAAFEALSTRAQQPYAAASEAVATVQTYVEWQLMDSDYSNPGDVIALQQIAQDVIRIGALPLLTNSEERNALYSGLFGVIDRLHANEHITTETQRQLRRRVTDMLNHAYDRAQKPTS